MTSNPENNYNQIPGEAKIILDAFSKIKKGAIEITTPDKMIIAHTGSLPGPKVQLQLKNWNVLSEVLNKSDIGLAETYIAQEWTTNSISDLIELAILNEDVLKKAFKGNWAKIIYYRLKHEARENTKSGSKKNIKAHYDLGNDFYTTWLDKTMTYSSALFNSNEESLSEAQNNKYQSMLDLINPKTSDHILEVGCGWGGFLEYAALKGHKVTGITISDEQYLYAKERIKNKKLDHLVEIKLCDYRDLEGSFDHAVSIEMIEAVGEKYWDSYFSLFKKVLKPNGRFAVQSIVINDADFDSYRKGTDFIQQYIFPGGMLLSPKTIKNLTQKHKYNFISMKNFGLDYAKTLNLWNDEFNKNIDSIKALKFDDNFIRLWNFYLGYCEGAFKAQRIDVVQFVAEIK